jgi:hypothetical protein
MSDYPEHDKLTKVSDESQSIGAFLEWLSTQGINLMEWRTFNEPKTCPCQFNTMHPGEQWSRRDNAYITCTSCGGTGKLDETYEIEQWANVPGSINELLARYFEIDLAAIEQEKRSMLAKHRSAS